ncbi:hypothetical protein KC19_6G176000 [Ceratodon purpureus]|uniref:Uncharacterized protein n=1 Tax=Ceratodon purpureus TaxID=3225 RepID=A0A8T0HIM1_CERPU|nr:hypothetical protein KC19_6G176000 [Ceratodon purpureus]
MHYEEGEREHDEGGDINTAPTLQPQDGLARRCSRAELRDGGRREENGRGRAPAREGVGAGDPLFAGGR